MRLTNLVFLVGLAIGAIPAYLLLDQLGQLLGMPNLTGTTGSLASIIWETLVPRILMIYTVLFICGVVLFRYLNSEVPLKWCLALGAIYGVGNVLDRPTRGRAMPYSRPLESNVTVPCSQ